MRAVVLALGGLGCGGPQSALEPSGLDAARVAQLWWLLFAISAVVFLAVTVFLLLSLRARSSPPEPSGDKRLWWAMALGSVATLILLVVIFIATLHVSRPLVPREEAELKLRITGFMWWWRVEYLDARSERVFETANELTLPVGRPVLLELVAGDVIHSFWVPRLSGKVDMIPGRTNQLLLQALEPGVFRGQCAEFCGLQHAKMAFFVVALPPDEFVEWFAHQRRAAPPVVDVLAQRGQQVFVEACARCHTIRGVARAQEPGSDLTHLASRLSLAAGTLPNRKGYLGGWVSNPQAIKKGNRMPKLPLSSEELHAVLHYLETLE